MTSHALDPVQFRHFLHNGRGRAILELQTHDAAPHREAILYSCLHDTVFDRQFGDDAQYIYEAIGLTGERTFYRDALLAALREPQEVYYLGQICDLLRLFATDGDHAARRALYEAFDREQDYNAMFAVVALDGLPGFLHVAESVGASTLADEEWWEREYFLSQLDDRHGAEVVRETVAAAAARSPEIAAYVAAIEKQRRQPKTKRVRFDPATMGYRELKEIVTSNGRWSPASLRRWGCGASDDELTRLAQDVLAETNPKRRAAYLHVFAERQFPLGHEALIPLIDSAEPRERNAATAALSNFSHPEVRALALHLLTTKQAQRGVALLRGNYRDGDYALIEAALAQPTARDEADQHWFEMEIRQLVEDKPTPAATSTLLSIYEQGRCLLCRYSTVKLLHRLGTLPESIRHECEFDANFDLRDAARRHFRDEGEAERALPAASP